MPPMGHYGNVETEIGRVVVQLANPDFKFMSGETHECEQASLSHTLDRSDLSCDARCS